MVKSFGWFQWLLYGGLVSLHLLGCTPSSLRDSTSSKFAWFVIPPTETRRGDSLTPSSSATPLDNYFTEEDWKIFKEHTLTGDQPYQWNNHSTGYQYQTIPLYSFHRSGGQLCRRLFVTIRGTGQGEKRLDTTACRQPQGALY